MEFFHTRHDNFRLKLKINVYLVFFRLNSGHKMNVPWVAERDFSLVVLFVTLFH